jgi:hypothetical protein
METKRRWIMQVLLACIPLTIAKSQAINATPTAFRPTKWTVVDKPQNGECPVCGTINSVYTERVGCLDSGNILIECTPPARLVRCSICSTAFYQDAEK